MAKLQDILVYLLANYPIKSELSNARVTKMVYLADWKHAIETGGQMSPINWFFNNYGPFVWDVKDTVEANPELFSLRTDTNFYGQPKLLIDLREEPYAPSLSNSERQALDHVIATTKQMDWASFIQLVYSTYPVVKSPRYSSLNLAQYAAEYRQSLNQGAVRA